MSSQNRSASLLSAFPVSARRVLISIGIGWAVVGIVEAAAYTVLADAVANSGRPEPVLAIAGASLVITVLCSRAGYLAGARLAGELYRALGVALARTKLAWFAPAHRALVTRAAGVGIPSLMGVPAHQLQTFILAPLVPILLLGGICLVSGPVPAALTAALLILALGAQVQAQRRLAGADAARHEAEREATTATLELVDHLELLRTAAGPVRALARAEEAWSSQEAAVRRTNRAAVPATLVSRLASLLPLAGILVFLAVTDGFTNPLSALALIILTGRASAPIEELAFAGISVNEVRAVSAGLRDVLSAPTLPMAQETAERMPRDNRIEILAASAEPALSPVTAVIPEGERARIAGPSGAGKSTLLGLLMRFDDPTSGVITLGGTPLTAMGEAELASRISYVPQVPVVFTGTIASNIRIGRPDASDREVADAATKAGLGPVLSRHESGIDQQVGRNGAALSGGECQRVAIARALIKRAPIMILDEATAALDEATERQVADAMAGVESTIIFVTHRTTDVWRADQTIELSGGRG